VSQTVEFSRVFPLQTPVAQSWLLWHWLVPTFPSVARVCRSVFAFRFVLHTGHLSTLFFDAGRRFAKLTIPANSSPPSAPPYGCPVVIVTPPDPQHRGTAISLRLGSSSPQAMQCEIRRIVPRQPGRLGTRCQALPTRYRRRLTSNSCWSCSLRLGSSSPQAMQCEIRRIAPRSLRNSVPCYSDIAQESTC